LCISIGWKIGSRYCRIAVLIAERTWAHTTCNMFECLDYGQNAPPATAISMVHCHRVCDVHMGWDHFSSHWTTCSFGILFHLGKLVTIFVFGNASLVLWSSRSTWSGPRKVSRYNLYIHFYFFYIIQIIIISIYNNNVNPGVISH
jgi:hypothetical protein